MKIMTATVFLILPLGALAEPIFQGDVTTELGPSFLLDDAAIGGGDFNAELADFDRALSGLWIGTEGAVLSITGIGWASPAGGTDATEATVTITYLGADGAIGGGDDVLFGSKTDNLTFSGAGEYVWRFDSPMTNSIDGSNGVFRVSINTGGSGNIRYKTNGLGVKLSVAGTSEALGDPIELIQDGGFEALTGTLPGTNTVPWASDNQQDLFDVIRETNVVRTGQQSLRLGYNFRNDVRVFQNLPPVNASLQYALTFWIRSSNTNSPSIRAEFRTKNGPSYDFVAKGFTTNSTSQWTPHVLYVSPADLAGHNGEEIQIRFRRMDALGAVFLDDVSLQLAAPTGMPTTQLFGQPPHFQHPNGGYLPQMFPFVDRFGQYKHATWDEKILDDADLLASAVEEEADILANPGSPEWTIYGGWENGPTLTATGYFRVEKFNGKWWFVDPLGKLFFSHGMTAINTDSHGTPITGREDYYEGLPEVGDPDYGFLVGDLMFHEEANAFRKYGVDWDDTLSDLAHRRLRSWGMNTIAAWSSTNIYLQRRTPYNQVLFPGSALPLANGFPDYFHPNFAANVAAALTQAVAQGIAEDPWCLGLFIHNELVWARPGTSHVNDVAKLTLAKGATQPAKIAFRDMLQAKYSTVAALNSAWGSSYWGWETNFLSVTNLPNETLATPDYEEFYTLYAETYYSTIKSQFEIHAPNTLYLGSRFTSNPHDRAAAASAAFTDVSSYHPYTVIPNVPQPFLDADVPVLIGEWQFIGKDTGLFGDAQRPANPPTQEQRAISYEAYANTAIDHPNLIGIHWFMYYDRAAGGDGIGEFPGANYNTGFMTVGNVPYGKVVEASREIGATMYGRRYGSFPPVVTHPQGNYPDIDDPTPFPISIVLSDDTSLPANLTLSGWSSNTNFVPSSGIVFTGTGSNRTLQLTPSTTEHAGGFITIVVTDESGVRSETPIFVMQGRPEASLVMTSPSQALLSWMSITDVAYEVQSTTNFTAWAVTGFEIPGSGGMTNTGLTVMRPKEVYRLRLSLP